MQLLRGSALLAVLANKPVLRGGSLLDEEWWLALLELRSARAPELRVRVGR